MESRLSSLSPRNPPPVEDSTDVTSRSLTVRIAEAVRSFAPLSLIAFGGPPAHIALLQDTFVVRKKWLDETLFAEYFAISQALPGPGSTEMLFSIAIHRGGLIPAVVGFLCWSLPGLVIMTGLGIGVGELPNPLPPWLLQLQNGISAAAVGLVAQAGTALSRKTVVDKPTLAVCTLAAATAVLYSASWLEPALIALGGVGTFVVAKCQGILVARNRRREETLRNLEDGPLQADAEGTIGVAGTETEDAGRGPTDFEAGLVMKETPAGHMPFSWKTGAAIFVIWLAILITFVALKDTVADIRPLAVLVQFYVAGCIIFGGGPVVIPLLYSYVVVPGWVAERDFLLGIALIQAMPGPNFNMAAYCGSLALYPWGPLASIAGGFLGYVGIFTPGLAMNAAAMPLWQKVRRSDALGKCLPGINAAAVGLVFSAAYLLWQRGITRGSGVEPLGNSPYFAVVAGCSYVLVNAGVRPPYVMLLSAVAGLVGWGFNV